MYEKIEQAKRGNTVIIYPHEMDELEDPASPLTLADLISMCTSFSLPYSINETPPYFTINPVA